MADKKAKGFHALEKKIHELEEEDRAPRTSAPDDGEEALVELEERERAAAMVPPSHEE